MTSTLFEPDGPRHGELRREARYAADNKRRRAADPAPSTVTSLRSQLLLALSPDTADQPCYAPEAMALLDAFEGALREIWEQQALLDIEARARAAVRRSLEALADGMLL